MTKKKREEAFSLIIERSYLIWIVSAADIDRLGIQKAVLEAMSIALQVVEEKVGREWIIIADGMNIFHTKLQDGQITQGDLLHYSHL